MGFKTLIKVLKIALIAWVSSQLLLLLTAGLSNRLLRFWNPSTSAFMHTDMLKNFRLPQQAWRPLKEISPHLIRAVLVSEDDRFFEHEGLDWQALEKSWKLNQKKGRKARGGSTLTMQLAKNLYLSSDKSYLRKAKEILLTWDLERNLSKERILELYLNLAQFGPGIYGAEAASRYYFHKSATHISPDQAAYLAAILPNPIYLTQRAKGRAKARQNIILRRMKGKELPKLD